MGYESARQVESKRVRKGGNRHVVGNGNGKGKGTQGTHGTVKGPTCTEPREYASVHARARGSYSGTKL